MDLAALPGQVIAGETASLIRGIMEEMIRTDHKGQVNSSLRLRDFPGSQPVSFTHESLELLEREDFWVCEKSDGLRVLMLILFNGIRGEQDVFLITRRNEIFKVLEDAAPRFPRHDDANAFQHKTLIDAELVIDRYPDGTVVKRCLVFDALVVNGLNVMAKPLVSRYGYMRSQVVQPYRELIDQYPQAKPSQAFLVEDKKMELAYGVRQILEQHLPSLHHGSDGLIFTGVHAGYTIGTDEHIIKWKPPSENSIDFQLDLRWPPLASEASLPDLWAKPKFILLEWMGGDRVRDFGELYMTDEEWEKIKRDKAQLEFRVVECVRMTPAELLARATNGAGGDEVDRFSMQPQWRLLRFRDDKDHGNHSSVVAKVLESIEHGVELDQLVRRQERIRSAWKLRGQERREREALEAEAAQRREMRAAKEAEYLKQMEPSSSSMKPSMGYVQ